MRGTVIAAKVIDFQGERCCYLVKFGEHEYAVLTSANDLVLQAGDKLHNEKGYWYSEDFAGLQVGNFNLKDKENAEAEYKELI